MIYTPNQLPQEASTPFAYDVAQLTDVHRQRAWIELSSKAFFHNAAQVKHYVGDAHIASVLKANAYGHGLIEMGQLCDATTAISLLTVAFLSEALALRNAGVKKPILVLSYSDGDVAQSLDNNIAFVVDSYQQVMALHAHAHKHQTSIDVHIKINTGLARRGLERDTVIEFVHMVRQLSHIRLMGICSHFSSAYTSAVTTQEQKALFASLVQNLIEQNIVVPFIHMSNSSCTDVANCNLFRTGVALYGYNPGHVDISLKPVLTFKTRVAQTRTLPANTSVGYDGTYRTYRPTILAYLPIGYFDGYDIRFSNVGVMYVRGGYASVCGRVGMNMVALDVTDIPGVSAGDEVVVLGDIDGIRGFDLCAQSGMHNVRELLACINPLLPRFMV